MPVEGPPEQAGAHYKCITLGSEDIPSPARDGGAGLGLGQEHEQVLEVPQLMPLFQAARTVLSGACGGRADVRAGRHRSAHACNMPTTWRGQATAQSKSLYLRHWSARLPAST